MADPGPGHGPRWRPKGALAEAELDGERVLWDPESGRVARLDRIGTLIWAGLDGNTGIDELAAELADAFATTSETVRADVEPFVARLSDLGFLVAETGEPI